MTKVSSSPYFKKANELNFNLNKVPWTFYCERWLDQWRLERNLEAVGPKLLRESLCMDPLVSATRLPKKMVNGLLKWRIQRLLNKPVEPYPNCYEPGSVATRGHLNECMGWKNLLGTFVDDMRGRRFYAGTWERRSISVALPHDTMAPYAQLQ
jgi:hypothetical protein